MKTIGNYSIVNMCLSIDFTIFVRSSVLCGGLGMGSDSVLSFSIYVFMGCM